MEREEKRETAGYSLWSERSPVPPPEGNRSDQEWVASAQAGDPKALAVLYERYRRPLLNYLYRFTGNQTAAEDLVQETFLRVVRCLGSYRPTGSVAGWIYRIARNLALNRIRDQRGHAELSRDEPWMNEEGEEKSREESLPAPTADPEQQAERAEMEKVIQETLLKVAPPYREALILCDIQRYPYKEAAEMLHCSINTIASRLARGRVRLAALLGYLKQERIL